MLFLAPLAGFSDPPLREVAKRFGCDVTVSEMISANALVFENEKTIKMLQHAPSETPFIVQIAGGDAQIIKKAVEILNKFDGIDGIDLNCGCPVPKVVKQGAGSALLTDISRLQKIIETIKTNSNKKFTSVKIRLGFNEKNAHEIAPFIERAGADYICVHGRTRAGGYHAKVDYEAIARVKSSVKIPLIANGDINSQNFTQVLKTTNANGAMIGRASIGHPWVFAEIKTSKSADEALKKRVILYHFERMVCHYGAHGIAIFRKHLHEYSKGKADAANFRQEINQISDEAQMRNLIENFF